jgi:hypothetical protein
MAIWGISPGDVQVIGEWPIELLPPKAAGVSQRTSRRAFMGDRRVIFFAEYYRFCLEMIFPRNIPVPLIALGGFERGHEFLIE